MSIFLITYFLREEDDEEVESCGCGCTDHDHEHHHDNVESGVEDEDEHEHYHYHLDAQLTAIIRSLGAWAHLMPTSFILKCDISAEEILDKLKVAVKDKDFLFVNKIEADTCASLSSDVIAWIKQ